MMPELKNHIRKSWHIDAKVFLTFYNDMRHNVILNFYNISEAFSKGTLKCVEVFQGKYDDCTEAVTKVLGWALCWPMKLTFICDILTSNLICINHFTYTNFEN